MRHCLVVIAVSIYGVLSRLDVTGYVVAILKVHLRLARMAPFSNCFFAHSMHKVNA